MKVLENEKLTEETFRLSDLIKENVNYMELEDDDGDGEESKVDISIESSNTNLVNQSFRHNLKVVS